MLLATFMIGLREGLEAALVVSILIAYVHRIERDDAVRRIWLGVALAAALAALLGALFTFGRYGLSFEAQEIIGGSMSILAVGMVTWMVFWMQRTGHRLKVSLEQEAHTALLVGSGWSLFWIAFVTVGREGLETTLMLWGWTDSLLALTGALLGIVTAVGIGYLLYRGLFRFDLGVFFAWSGGLLILLSAGILAYGVHDLQEARVLPGPFSGAPITPTDFATGEVLIGFATKPFWFAAFPFGWAFDLSGVIDPSGFLASLLKGTIGFTPQMSWLEVLAWAAYLAIVFPIFIRQVRRQRARRSRAADSTAPRIVSPTGESESQ